MKQLSSRSQNEEKDILIRYLMGERLAVLKVRLVEISTVQKQSCKNLYQSIELDPLDPYLDQIFKNLNLSEKEKTSLYNRCHNLYELIQHLEYSGHHSFEYFLYLIDKTTPPKNWGFIFMMSAFFSMGASIFYHLQAKNISKAATWVGGKFPAIEKWAKKTFSALKNFALMGFILNSVNLLYTWYHALAYRLDTKKFRINSLIFNTLSLAFTISAYATTYFVGGAVATASATLFILGAATDVVRSLYFLWTSRSALEKLSKPDLKTATTEQQLAYERAINLHHRSLDILYLKFGVASAVTIAVVATSFIPMSLLVTIGCFSFISFVSIAQHSIKNMIKKNYAEQLQEHTKELCDNSLHHTLIHTNALSQLNNAWELVNFERRKLQLEKAEFEREKQQSAHQDKPNTRNHSLLFTPQKPKINNSSDSLDTGFNDSSRNSTLRSVTF